MIPLSVLDLAPIVQGGDAAQAFRHSRDLAQHVEAWGSNRSFQAGSISPWGARLARIRSPRARSGAITPATQLKRFRKTCSR